MKYYEIIGKIMLLIYKFLKQIRFKNIKKVNIGLLDCINIEMKDNTIAKIICLEPGTNCITWSIEDFEMTAYRLKGNNWKDYYNQEQFQATLDKMIDKHDAQWGINWDIIEYYLNEYCKIK